MNAMAEPIARPEFAPGIFPGMAFETYHAVEAMSASGAKKILQSPMHYRLNRDKPSQPTERMQFGSVVHIGVLEPDTMHERVAIAPDVDRRTKAGKEEWQAFLAESAGRIVLAQAEYDRARRCIDAVRAHPGASHLLEGAATEISLFWNDARYGVPCKARWDIFNYDGVADLKTTVDASPDGFGRQIANLLYHVQAAHYCSGGEHVRHESPRFFAFIAVESEEPHAVACYVLPGSAILAGAYLMSKALARYEEALRLGHFPGYPDTIEEIHLPRYALRFDD